MDKSKITKSLAVFASVLLIIIIGVASFAYFGTFNVNLNNNVAVNINSSSPGNATFTSTATQLNLQVPAANMSFTVANNTVAAKEDTAFLDVTLTGSSNLLTTCTYDIVYAYDAGSNVYGQGTTTKTSGATKEITIEVNGMNGNNNFAVETNFDHANIQSYYDSTNKYYKLVEGAKIQSLGTEQSVRWKITGRYYNLDVSQAQLGGKNFTGKIYAISKGCSSEDGTTVKKGYETILANNGGAASMTTLTSTDFATATTASDKGMYKAQDDLGTSYYFRGAVDNNWVKFGKDSSGKDIYWRIIRINGDGSIRMIYTGTTAPTESTKVVMTGPGTQIGTSKFNSSTDKAEYVGYMYTSGQQYGTSTDSTIKTTIDNWYAGTTLKDNPLVSKDQIFCNDRSPSSTQTAAWTSTGWYSYGAYGRLVSNKTPTLKCPIASDKFTVNVSKGNGSLTYPVGLITADEIAMAGGVNGSSNSSYYLYTNQNYWSGPSYFNGSTTSAFEFYVGFSGGINSYIVYSDYGARPVISLSSKTKLSGSGTYNDIYTVVGGNSTEDTSSGKSFDTVFAANNTDIFNENGLRYEGADPKNYICLDNKTSGACSSSSLLFRIIGLFDEDTSTDGTSSSGTKKLLKVIDTNNYGGTDGKKWNSAGTNNWSTASLKTELNGTYLTTLLGSPNVNSKLSNSIANAKWHLGGASSSNYNTLTAEGIYKEERNTSAIYSGNPSSIYAKVGLMYPSDYGYATIGGTNINKSECRTRDLYDWDGSIYSDCRNNDWLFISQNNFVNNVEWTITPRSDTSGNVLHIRSTGNVSHQYNYIDVPNFYWAARPTFYLDSSVLKIVGTGDGTKDNAYRVG